MDPGDPRRVLQPRTVCHSGHQPARRSLCDQQDVETGARACAIRRTRTTTRWPISSPIYPALGNPKAFVATPVFDGPRMSAIMVLSLPDRADQQRPVGQSAMGSGGPGEDRRSLPDRSRSDDADDSRFLIEDRAAFLATLRRSTLTSTHGRHRRHARHDDPHASREARRPPRRRFGARPA